MSETIAESLRHADGARLNQSQYEEDFGANLWRVDGADSWKLECMQSYSEIGFPSWEAFMAGDWNTALRLYERERPGIAAFHEKFRRHHSCLYRVRVVAEPVTPYVQWELHCLKLRAECGEKIRVVSPSAISAHEPVGALPELISLCGRVLYHTVYDDREQPDGALRYADPELIAGYENFARGLYEAGEDVESYFRRAIAGLPPPPAQDRGGHKT
jgi:hypothetical protein